MVSMNWWNNKQEENWKRDARLQVLQTVKRAEKAVKSNMKNLFTDVCDVMPRSKNISLYKFDSKSEILLSTKHYMIFAVLV